MKTDGYIGENKNGISKSRLKIWVGQLDVRCIVSHCIALPKVLRLYVFNDGRA